MNLAPPLLALSVVLLAAASGSGDYELVTPLPEKICAKSAETCEAARKAIARGWFTELPRNTPTECRIHVGCFPERDSYIENFNMPAGLRR